VIKITFKDLTTGEITKDPLFEGNVFWWTEGNGACDCNRAIACDKNDEMDAAMREAHPGIRDWQSYCYGCKRFIAVDVEGDFEGMSKTELLAALNREYPAQ
jgi:hypothetical protein